MKSNAMKRVFSALLLLVLLASALPITAHAAGGSLYVTGYTVTDSAGSPVGSVTKGATVNITVSIKDTGTGASDPMTLDVTKLDDSFTGGSVRVESASEPGQPLAYRVVLTGVQYKGVGQNLRVQIGTAGQPESYQTMEVTVTEAVVYEAPQFTPEPPSSPEAAPAPMVLISRSDIAKPLEAGQEVELTVSFRNLSPIQLKSPVATFTPSDGLSLSGGNSSFLLDDIGGKKTVSVKVRVKAGATIPSPNQSLGVDLKFNYNNNISFTQGTISDKIAIPALARESVPQPVVVVTRSPIAKPISAGETVNVAVSFKNAGATKLISPVVTMTTSDALMIQNDTSTFLLGDIEPGTSASVTVQVKASKEISSPNQSLSTELKYSYDNGGTITQATASDRVNLSANTTAEGNKPDSPVPNLVIRKFTYGPSSVAAGSKFPLSITFENTGTLRVENVVVTVDGGESFAMDGSTNTFFYKSLAGGGSQTLEVPMQSVPTGKSGAQSVNVSFKYEFVDKEKRSQASADIKISVPVYQPDRFQINAPTVPETVSVGEEAEISLAYVNKGKDDIANVEATVVGEGVDTPARTQYLGNITAGSSGNIGFALTPTQEGEVDLVLKISYENANQELQTREFPLTLQVQEQVIDDLGEDIPMEEPTSFPWLWVCLGGGAAVVVAAVVLMQVRKRKKAAALDSAQDWDNWEETDTDTPQKEE